jgi:alcohol dehydrogenase
MPVGLARLAWLEAVPLPHIPGHEFAGVIAAVGAQVRSFAPGDRVTAPFVNGCGRCDWCRAGDAQICPDQTQPGFSHAGSFAERVVVRVADVNLVRLPDELDFVSAAALGCRFATAFRALTGYRRVEPGDWVVAATRARAAELGAVAIDVAETSTAIAELTGAGAHLSVDAVGSAATALAAVSGLRRGGQHVQVGLMLDADALAPLPWELLVARELRVAGSHGMSAADYPAMLAMITDGRLDLGELIAERIPLEKAGAAMMAMDNPMATRAGITVAVSDTGG